MAPFHALAASLALLASSTASPTTLNGILAPRIGSGSEASKGDLPSIVSTSKNGKSWCPGTLVNSKTIVTAAHCSILDASSVKVRAGSVEWDDDGKEVDVSKIIVHPDWKRDHMQNDIAVWQLDDGIDDDDGISYAELPKSGAYPNPGTLTDIGGWGVNEKKEPQDKLRKGKIVTLPLDGCQQYFEEDPLPVGKSQFCAGQVGSGSHPCEGDSGGPLLSGKTLLGTMSWGDDCADGGGLQVYTLVSAYLDFIKDNKKD